MITKRLICVALNTSLCVSTLALFGCNNQSPQAPGTSPGAAASASAPAPAPAGSTATAATAASAYKPPSADQLYQLVAPIALFPDNLVAQVLAGSSYPDQITAADQLLAQNPKLKGPMLQTAVNPQPWDPSVKGLTAFPSVLDQMSKNIQWTSALGTAYANDPTDVMNAIQVMRERASQHGSLKSTPQQRVTTEAIAAVPPSSSAPCPMPVAGPTVVPAPQQTIEIAPAQSDVVYVPSYDPQTVYGEQVAYYPGYSYVSPGYSTGDVVVAGAIGFGAGILIANLFDHHGYDGWGWHSWGMRWGGYGGGGWQRPAVVHNNNVYVSHSNNVINRYTTNNVTNNRFVNNGQINHAGANGAFGPQARAAGPMTTPNFHNAMQNHPQAQERAEAAHAGAAQRFNAAAANQPRENAATERAATAQAARERPQEQQRAAPAREEFNRPAAAQRAAPEHRQAPAEHRAESHPRKEEHEHH